MCAAQFMEDPDRGDLSSPSSDEARPPQGSPHLSISDQPVKQIETEAAEAADDAPVHGADVRFYGVVRGLEHGRAISGIRYSAFLPMARRELERIAQEGAERFVRHGLFIHHAIGFIAAGEASVVIRVRTPHSADAFAAARWYLAAVKARLPIWKEPVFDEPAQ